MTHSTLTRNAARQTGIDADELHRLADYSETRTRELMASGVPMGVALETAADETMTLARTLGVI